MHRSQRSRSSICPFDLFPRLGSILLLLLLNLLVPLLVPLAVQALR